MLPTEEYEKFVWASFDVLNLLPSNFLEEVNSVVTTCSVDKRLRPTSVTSREDASVSSISVSTVSGEAIRDNLPWLWHLYHNEFLNLAQQVSTEQVQTASRDKIKINLNTQLGNKMRYECHVDSNPIEGLLYLTSHRIGEGGELVISRDTDAKSVAEVDKNCSIVYPVAGNLIFFDGRKHPHYVRFLQSLEKIRIVVAMNYYTPSWDESKRPADLDHHLFGDTQEK